MRTNINIGDLATAKVMIVDGNMGALMFITHLIHDVKVLEILDDMNVRGEQLYAGIKFADEDPEKFTQMVLERDEKFIAAINADMAYYGKDYPLAVKEGGRTGNRPTMGITGDESLFDRSCISLLAKSGIYDQKELDSFEQMSKVQKVVEWINGCVFGRTKKVQTDSQDGQIVEKENEETIDVSDESVKPLMEKITPSKDDDKPAPVIKKTAISNYELGALYEIIDDFRNKIDGGEMTFEKVNRGLQLLLADKVKPRWGVWKTITLGTHKSLNELLDDLPVSKSRDGAGIDEELKERIRDIGIPISPIETKLKLIRVNGIELGLKESIYDEEDIYRHADELGLMPIPAEGALQLLKQYGIYTEGDSARRIAIEPLPLRKEFPNSTYIFGIEAEKKYWNTTERHMRLEWDSLSGTFHSATNGYPALIFALKE